MRTGSTAGRRLGFLIFIFIFVLYYGSFMIGLLVGSLNPSIYHEVYVDAYRSLKSSPILEIYRMIFFELYSGHEMTALIYAIALGISSSISRVVMSIIPFVPSYSFFMDGVLSAPISRLQLNTLILVIPVELAGILGYSMVSTSVIMFVLAKLFNVKGLNVVEYSVVGIVLIFISSILEAVLSSLVLFPVQLLHLMP